MYTHYNKNKTDPCKHTLINWQKTTIHVMQKIIQDFSLTGRYLLCPLQVHQHHDIVAKRQQQSDL